jgi:hypothetical protein
LRAAKTPRLVSSMAILGFIAFSTLIVLILNSASLANPALPFQSGSPNGNAGPTGDLVLQLLSNQDERDRLSNPSTQLFAIGEKAMLVSQGTNSSSAFGQVMVTNTAGLARQELPPGRYVVNLRDESLNINIPVQVSAGNETTLKVVVLGAAYQLVYSEESGVHPVAGTAQSNVYVQLKSSTSVANVSQTVILKVRGAGQGAGYLVNATVVSRQPPTGGFQWLELGAVGAVNPVNATSMVLTTWTYSSSITVRPNPLQSAD